MRARYRVDLGKPIGVFELRLDRPRWTNADHADQYFELPSLITIITAFNPVGRARTAADNNDAHRRLCSMPAVARHTRFPSMSDDGFGNHQEPGLAIVGLSRAQSLDLARTFGQLAIVIATPDAAGLLWSASESLTKRRARWTRRKGETL